MSRFELNKIECVPENFTEEHFFKLKVDGKCEYDIFYKKMEKAGNTKKDLNKISSTMVLLAEGHESANLKKLKGRTESVDSYMDYEIKCGRLRVYLFEDEEEGKIIVLGELKKDAKGQKKNIAKMRKLKLEYFKEKEALMKAEKIKIDLEAKAQEEELMKAEKIEIALEANVQEEEGI